MEVTANERGSRVLTQKTPSPFPFAQSRPPMVDRAVSDSSSLDGDYSSGYKL